jgi:hypothetical protein
LLNVDSMITASVAVVVGVVLVAVQFKRRAAAAQPPPPVEAREDAPRADLGKV